MCGTGDTGLFNGFNNARSTSNALTLIAADWLKGSFKGSSPRPHMAHCRHRAPSATYRCTADPVHHVWHRLVRLPRARPGRQ